MNDGAVLLVDSDEAFLNRWRELLHAQGVDVVGARTISDGLQAWRNRSFALVVVEERLLNASSDVSLVDTIRDKDPLQLIVVTGEVDHMEKAVSVMEQGVFDYLVKPISLHELLRVVHQATERPVENPQPLLELARHLEQEDFQQLYYGALLISRTLETDRVCESLLTALSEVCDAQGAALWLLRDEADDLMLACWTGIATPDAVGARVEPANLGIGAALLDGTPLLCDSELEAESPDGASGQVLVAPLLRRGRVVGLVKLLGKLGQGFEQRDIAYAKMLADTASVSLQNARKHERVKRLSLRDTHSTAYSMTYFVDCFARELQKAERYQRTFAIVVLKCRGLSQFKTRVNEDEYKQLHHQITVRIDAVLRDIDILAQVGNDKFFVLVPEGNFLTGALVGQRICESIEADAMIAGASVEIPIRASFGPAAFPADGADVEGLFEVCKRRARHHAETRKNNPVMGVSGFSQMVEGLLRSSAPLLADDLEGGPRLASAVSCSCGVLDSAVTKAIGAQIIEEALGQTQSPGWLFVMGRDNEALIKGEALLQGFEGGRLQVYVIGADSARRLLGRSNVTGVSARGGQVSEHDVLLLCTENQSYGFIGRKTDDGSSQAYHTVDWVVVLGLVDKLQTTYQLQKELVC